MQEVTTLVLAAKEKYIDKHPVLKRRMRSVEAITEDDMIFCAKNMLDLQQDFLENQIPGYIGMSTHLLPFHAPKTSHSSCHITIITDVGYHFTSRRNMASIQVHGLLPGSDQKTKKVGAKKAG